MDIHNAMQQVALEAALKALEIHARTHPRPPWVNQEQAGKMLGLSKPTIKSLLDAGKIRRNGFGKIPIEEIDRLLAAQGEIPHE